MHFLSFPFLALNLYDNNDQGSDSIALKSMLKYYMRWKIWNNHDNNML